jgi:hypothetical protein
MQQIHIKFWRGHQQRAFLTREIHDLLKIMLNGTLVLAVLKLLPTINNTDLTLLTSFL